MTLVLATGTSDGARQLRLTEHPWSGWLPWGLALLVVLTVHGLAAWYLLASRDQAIALPQGGPAILMDLAPAPAASSAAPSVPAATSAPVPPQQSPAASMPAPPETPSPAQTSSVQTPSPQMPVVDYHPMPHPPASMADLTLPQIAADTVLPQPVKHAVTPKSAKPAKQKPTPPAVKPAPALAQTRTTAPASVTATAPAAPTQVQSPTPVPSPSVPTSVASQPAAAATQNSTAQASATQASAAQASTMPASAAKQQQDGAAATKAVRSAWLGEAVRYIAKFKRPTDHDLRKPLRVLISFSVDRSGTLLWRRVQQSSGRHDVDGDALALIGRADPLPPPPSDISDTNLVHGFTIPVDFSPY